MLNVSMLPFSRQLKTENDFLQALSSACRRTKELANQFQRANEEAPPIGRKLDQLPTEVLAIIISQFLTVKDVGRLSQVNKRFKVSTN